MAKYSFQAPDGSTISGTMDDSILSQSKEQQAATMEDLQKQVFAARAAKPPVANPADTADTMGNALRAGASSALQGVGQGMKQLGGALPESGVSRFLTNNADSVSNAVAPPKEGYVPPTSRMADSFNKGNYGEMLSELPMAAVQAAPQMGAMIAGGALGGIPGAAAVSTALNAGPNIAHFAEKSGEDPNRPGLASALKGAALTAPMVAADTFGIRGFNSAISKVPTEVARSGLRTAREAAGQGALSTVDQLGRTGTVDPGQVAASALAGGAARGLGEAPRLAASGTRAAAQGTTDALMSRYGVDQPTTKAESDSVQRMKALVDDQATADDRGRKIEPAARVKSVYTEKRAELKGLLTKLKEAEVVSPDEYTRVLQTLEKQATVATNTVSSAEHSAWNSLESLGRIPADTMGHLKTLVTDVDTLSAMRFKRNQTGPAEAVLGKLGGLAAVGTSLAHGNLPMAALTALGSGFENRIGARIGSVMDRAFGLQKPELDWQSQAAERLYGKTDSPSSAERTDFLNAQQFDRNSALWRVMGFAPDQLKSFDDAVTARKGIAAKEAADYKDATATNNYMIDDKHRVAAAANKEFDQAQADLPRPLNPREQMAYDQGDAKVIGSGLSKAAKSAAMAKKVADKAELDGQTNAQRVQDAIAKSTARMREKATTLKENAARQVEGMDYKKNPAVLEARANGVVGRAALGAKTPEDMFASTNGMKGSPRSPTEQPMNTPLDPQGRPYDTAQVPTDTPGLRQPAPRPAREPAASPRPKLQDDFTDEAHPADLHFGGPMGAYARKTANDHMPEGSPKITQRKIEEAAHSAAANGAFEAIQGNIPNAEFVAAALGANADGHSMLPQLAQIIAKEAMKNVIGGKALRLILASGPKGLSRSEQKGTGGTTSNAPHGLDGKGNPVKNPIAFKATTEAQIRLYHDEARAARERGFNETARILDVLGGKDFAKKLDKVAEVNKLIARLGKVRGDKGAAELAYASNLLHVKSPLLKGD